MIVLENLLNLMAGYIIMFFEFVGVTVIAFTGIRGFLFYICRKPDIRLTLAKGLATGLEFKMGSEILRTVVVRDIQEIVIVGAIIFLRAILTFLIQWEIKNEAAQIEDKKTSKSG